MRLSAQDPPESVADCGPAQNAYMLTCMLRFFAEPRLVLIPDPHFLDSFKLNK
jgi:hypothetical protein